MIDKDIKPGYDTVELEEMVQVGLLCTQFNLGHCQEMCGAVRMLEGDGLEERREDSQKFGTLKI